MHTTKAYEQAGIGNPLEVLADVRGCLTITGPSVYGDLGFVGKGRGKDALDDGLFAPNGTFSGWSP